MTLANKITAFRIGLIPLFAIFGIGYGWSLNSGVPKPGLRLAATVVFLLASLSDGLDGFIARRFQQKTRLGTVLDPLADKLLVLVALVLLSFRWWPNRFPLWFPIIVISRDLVLVFGFLAAHQLGRELDVRPSRLGKAATVLQLVSIAWVLTGVPWPPPAYLAASATVPVVLSGVGYLIKGSRQIAWTKKSSAG
jgi:cardiolipin synthase (CMP-forming)